MSHTMWFFCGDRVVLEGAGAGMARSVWAVGALCRAISDHLQARFNPISVRGELSGFALASSGHCYFTLKDDQGQLRCAMFKRAATTLLFQPRDGDTVELLGRLTVYEPRGDLQLVVEEMRLAGQGQLFEQFLKLKAKLAFEGLFDPGRKRPLPSMPRVIGLVTSLQAAALQDVLTTLKRRAPHLSVVLAPSSVQGAQAPAELVQALQGLYALARPLPRAGRKVAAAPDAAIIEVILLVRGGGSLEDLWAFNDEQLARVLAQSPVPVLAGVGHETDFTIADFVADVRAPTPTAAAELVAPERQTCLDVLDAVQRRITDGLTRCLDRQGQRLDSVQQRLGRPSQRLSDQRLLLSQQAHGLQRASQQHLTRQSQVLDRLGRALPLALERGLMLHHNRLELARLRLSLLDPHLVLERGYAWLSDAQGQAVTRASQTHKGQHLIAILHDGAVDLTVNTEST